MLIEYQKKKQIGKRIIFHPNTAMEHQKMDRLILGLKEKFEIEELDLAIDADSQDS